MSCAREWATRAGWMHMHAWMKPCEILSEILSEFAVAAAAAAVVVVVVVVVTVVS